MNSLNAQQLRQAADLKEKIEALQLQLGKLLGSPAAQATPAQPAKRQISAAGKARIAAAARARWAKVRAAKPAPKSGKRKLSKAAKARLSALAKERWAKAKEAGKAKL